METWTEAIADTMLHEMVHYYCYLNDIQDCEGDYHTEVFRNEAVTHGLDCEKTVNGWSATGISVIGWIAIQFELDEDTAERLGWSTF